MDTTLMIHAKMLAKAIARQIPDEEEITISFKGDGSYEVLTTQHNEETETIDKALDKVIADRKAITSNYPH